MNICSNLNFKKPEGLADRQWASLLVLLYISPFRATICLKVEEAGRRSPEAHDTTFWSKKADDNKS